MQHIDGINLFGLISIASLLYCTPAAILMEGSKWSGAYSGALQSVGRNEFFKQMAAAGIFYHLYNQVCFLAVLFCCLDMMHTQYMTANTASELRDAFVKKAGIMGKLVLSSGLC